MPKGSNFAVLACLMALVLLYSSIPPNPKPVKVRFSDWVRQLRVRQNGEMLMTMLRQPTFPELLVEKDATPSKTHENPPVTALDSIPAVTPTPDTSVASVTVTDAPQGDNAHVTYNLLRGAGFTPQAACGVLGNLYEESGIDPRANEGGDGPGRGIAQWGYNGGAHGSNRFNALLAWASASDRDPWSLQTQLEYMLIELYDMGILDELKLSTRVDTATALFHDGFEKSNDRNTGTYYQRELAAYGYYSRFGNL